MEMKGVQENAAFVEEALVLGREFIDLRAQLSSAQAKYNLLIQQRESAALEGRDLLPQISTTFQQLEDLPGRIGALEDRLRWAVMEGVATINMANTQRAAKEYQDIRDLLRHSLEVFRVAWISVERRTRESAEQGALSPKLYNPQIDEVEKLTGIPRLPRVEYDPVLIAGIDTERLRREGLLAAIDMWIGQLH